jgi:hypothetical protein
MIMMKNHGRQAGRQEEAQPATPAPTGHTRDPNNGREEEGAVVVSWISLRRPTLQSIASSQFQSQRHSNNTSNNNNNNNNHHHHRATTYLPSYPRARPVQRSREQRKDCTDRQAIQAGGHMERRKEGRGHSATRILALALLSRGGGHHERTTDTSSPTKAILRCGCRSHPEDRRGNGLTDRMEDPMEGTKDKRGVATDPKPGQGRLRGVGGGIGLGASGRGEEGAQVFHDAKPGNIGGGEGRASALWDPYRRRHSLSRQEGRGRTTEALEGPCDGRLLHSGGGGKGGTRGAATCSNLSLAPVTGHHMCNPRTKPSRHQSTTAPSPRQVEHSGL